MSETTRAEVFKGKDGRWFFHLRNKGNGEIVSSSEGYARRIDAVNEATALVGDNVDDVEVVDP